MKNFAQWLTYARPGTTFVYYHGALAYDRALAADAALADAAGHPKAPAPTPLYSLEDADMALNYANSGHVALVQKANGPVDSRGRHESFTYIAQRTDKKLGATGPTA